MLMIPLFSGRVLHRLFPLCGPTHPAGPGPDLARITQWYHLLPHPTVGEASQGTGKATTGTLHNV